MVLTVLWQVRGHFIDIALCQGLSSWCSFIVFAGGGVLCGERTSIAVIVPIRPEGELWLLGPLASVLIVVPFAQGRSGARVAGLTDSVRSMREITQLSRHRPGREPRRTMTSQSEPLWREVLGARLRRLRRHHGLTLIDLAQKAGLSSQYLSEVERGRKDPSSEMIAAITGALGVSLIELTAQVADELRRDTLSFIDFTPAQRDCAGTHHTGVQPSQHTGRDPMVQLAIAA